jgi:mitochondrial import inner membrane translocase subunit TIM13
MAFGGLFGGSDSSSSNSTTTNTSSPSSQSISFSSSPPPPSSTSTSTSSNSSIRERLQTTLTQQSNIANARYLISKVNENCFAHCVPSPSTSLSTKEQTCLSSCMEKYIEAWNVTSRTYVGRLQREGAQLGGSIQQGGHGGGSF